MKLKTIKNFKVENFTGKTVLNAAYLVTCDFCNRAIYTEEAENTIQFIKEIQKIGWEKSNGWQKSQSKWHCPEHSHQNLFSKLK